MSDADRDRKTVELLHHQAWLWSMQHVTGKQLDAAILAALADARREGAEEAKERLDRAAGMLGEEMGKRQRAEAERDEARRERDALIEAWPEGSDRRNVYQALAGDGYRCFDDAYPDKASAVRAAAGLGPKRGA